MPERLQLPRNVEGDDSRCAETAKHVWPVRLTCQDGFYVRSSLVVNVVFFRLALPPGG